MDRPARCYGSRPLPARPYRPGRDPHPDHGGRRPLSDAPFSADCTLEGEQWKRCEPYLHAIDLFNHGCFWEAHEAFEPLWRRAGRRSGEGRHLQGLIQLAAALLKHVAGERRGALRLLAMADEKLGGRPAVLLGVDRVALVRTVRDLIEGRRSTPPRIRLRGMAYTRAPVLAGREAGD